MQNYRCADSWIELAARSVPTTRDLKVQNILQLYYSAEVAWPWNQLLIHAASI